MISRMLARAALGSAAFFSCSTTTEALAFDVASRSSSAFGSIVCTRRAFPMAAPTTRHDPFVMRVGSSTKRGRASKASSLIERNNERLKDAGRPGTKSFADPTKIFVGNLPYDADEADVTKLFADYWNISVEAVGDRLESVKVIRDWRSGKSKGYGFVQFYEPMAATAAMDYANTAKGWGWRIKGRRIRLDQGKRNPNEEEAARQRRKEERREARKQEDLDGEGRAILAALEETEGKNDDASAGGVAAVVEDEDAMSEDDMITFLEKGGLREVMPLTEETAAFLGIEGVEGDDGFDEIDDFAEYYNEHGYQDDDFDGTLDDDDEELVYDGVFEDAYNPGEYEELGEGEEAGRRKMNREQRRVADRKRKKRKLPFKGFGAPG